MKTLSKKTRRSSAKKRAAFYRRLHYEERIESFARGIEEYIRMSTTYRLRLQQVKNEEKKHISDYNAEVAKLKKAFKKKPRTCDATFSFCAEDFDVQEYKNVSDFKFADGKISCCAHEDYRTCYNSCSSSSRWHQIMCNGNFKIHKLRRTMTFKCALYERLLHQLLKGMPNVIFKLVLGFVPLAHADELLFLEGKSRHMRSNGLYFMPVNVGSSITFRREFGFFELSLVSAECDPHSWILRRGDGISASSHSYCAEAQQRVQKAPPGMHRFVVSTTSAHCESPTTRLQQFLGGASFRISFHCTRARLGFSK